MTPNVFVPSGFEFLIKERGYVITAHEESFVFDNALTIISDHELVIKFIKDRGDVYVEVRRACDAEWMSLNLIRIALQKAHLISTVPINQLGDFLRFNYDEIRAFVFDKSAFETIDSMGRRRAEVMFGGRNN